MKIGWTKNFVVILLLLALAAPTALATGNFIDKDSSGESGQNLSSRREQAKKECEAQQGGGSGGSDFNIPVPPPPPPPDTGSMAFNYLPSAANKKGSLAHFFGQTAFAQNNILDRELSSFSNIGEITSALNREGGHASLVNFLTPVQRMGGTVGQLSSGSYRTVGDLYNINHLPQTSSVLGQLNSLGANFGQLISGYNNIDGLFRSLGGFGSEGLAGLGQTFGQIRGLGGTYNQLLGGDSSNFSDLLNNFGNIQNLGSLANVFGQFRNLQGTFGQMLGGFGNFSNLLGGFGQLSDLGGFANVLGHLSGIGGNFSNVFSGFDNFAGAFGSFANIQNLGGVGNALGQIGRLGGNIDQLFGGFDNLGQALQSLGNLPGLGDLGNALGALGLMGNNFGDILNPFGGNFGNFMDVMFQDGVIPGLENVFPGLGDVLGGNLSTLDSVPVHEVGELLSVTKDIQKLNEEMKSLQIQACTHLKVIRDMQLALEEKEFKFDPDARKASMQAIAEHKKRIVDEAKSLLKQGYNVSEGVNSVPGETKQSLQPTSLEQYFTDVRKEASGLLRHELDKTDQSKILFKDKILASYDQEEAVTFSETLQPTQGWSEERYKKYLRGESENFLEDQFLINIPTNNPSDVYAMIAAERLGRMAAAEQNAREELVAGGGLLPTRKCAVEMVDDGRGNKFCPRWNVLTIGSIIRDYVVALLTSALRQLESGDESTEDFLKEELVKNVETQLRQGLGNPREVPPSIADGSDPSPSPGPSPDSGFDYTPPESPEGGWGDSGNGSGGGGGWNDNVSDIVSQLPETNPGTFGRSDLVLDFGLLTQGIQEQASCDNQWQWADIFRALLEELASLLGGTGLDELIDQMVEILIEVLSPACP